MHSDKAASSGQPPSTEIYKPRAWSYVRTFMLFAFVGLLETALLLLVAPFHLTDAIATFSIGVWVGVSAVAFFWHHEVSRGDDPLDEPLASLLLVVVPVAGTICAVVVFLDPENGLRYAQRLFLIAWGVIPPAWFVYESYSFRPRHGIGSMEHYKEGRSAAEKLWAAGVVITLLALHKGWDHRFPPASTAVVSSGHELTSAVSDERMPTPH